MDFTRLSLIHPECNILARWLIREWRMVKVIMGNVGRKHAADEREADRIVRDNIQIMKLCKNLSGNKRFNEFHINVIYNDVKRG